MLGLITVYSDFQPGPNMRTGRDLDIAVSGEGFIAVQTRMGMKLILVR